MSISITLRAVGRKSEASSGIIDSTSKLINIDQSVYADIKKCIFIMYCSV